MKKTPWFPGSVKPVHVGVYEREACPVTDPYSKWDGSKWCLSDKTPSAASGWYVDSSSMQNLAWRGIVKDGK